MRVGKAYKVNYKQEKIKIVALAGENFNWSSYNLINANNMIVYIIINNNTVVKSARSFHYNKKNSVIIKIFYLTSLNTINKKQLQVGKLKHLYEWFINIYKFLFSL